MRRQLSWLCVVFLCLFPWLVSSGHAGEVEQLLAAAKQAEQAGQLDAAAELYHRAAAMRPEDFTAQVVASLIQRAAILFDATVLKRGKQL
jgi:predicted TPR repeat methyltransferase